MTIETGSVVNGVKTPLRRMRMRIVELNGWTEMQEDIQRLTGSQAAEPDFDEVYSAVVAGETHIEVSSIITSSGLPELVTIPDDVREFFLQEADDEA